MKILATLADNKLVVIDTIARNLKVILKFTSRISFRGITKYKDLIIIARYNSSNNGSDLIFIDTVKNKRTIKKCINTKDIRDIVCVSKNKLYTVSRDTDTINCITFDPDIFDILSDIPHFEFPEDSFLNSLINYKTRWYGSKRSEVIEITNNRQIYSGLMLPDSMLFDSQGDLCFCEFNRFHYGNKVIQTDGFYKGLIEDVARKGYWIGNSPNMGGCSLQFIHKEKGIQESIKVAKYGSIGALMILDDGMKL